MASDGIQSLSLELLHRIFQDCDNFRDLVAFASSCKTTYAAWLSSASILIWSLAPTTYLCFDSALMAVRFSQSFGYAYTNTPNCRQARAIKIVADAQSRGTEPPHLFPVRELSGHVKQPMLEEMKAVSDLEHLVKCVERMMFHWKIRTEPGARLNVAILLSKPKSADDYGERNERVYRSIYNILLAGAVCSRPYNTPFFKHKKKIEPIFWSVVPTGLL